MSKKNIWYKTSNEQLNLFDNKDLISNPTKGYHGTNNRFETNDFKIKPSKRFVLFSEFDVTPQGFFFTEDPEEAKEYGKNVHEVYLDFQRPFLDPENHNETKTLSNEKIKEIIYILQPLIKKDENGFDYIEIGVGRYYADNEGWYYNAIGNGGLHWDVLDNFQVVSRIRSLGYDSTYVYEPDSQNGVSIMVFNKDQIIPVNEWENMVSNISQNKNWYKMSQNNIWEYTSNQYVDKLNPKKKWHSEDIFGNYTVERLNTFLSKKRFPLLIHQEKINGINVEFRQTGRKESYIKRDENGDIARDEQGEALSLSEEEILEKGYSLYDIGIGAFYGEKAIGFIGDSFGATEVYVAKEYQGMGVGTILEYLFRKTQPFRPSGGFSDSGEKTIRKVHKRFVEEAKEQGEEIPEEVLKEYNLASINHKAQYYEDEYEDEYEDYDTSFMDSRPIEGIFYHGSSFDEDSGPFSDFEFVSDHDAIWFTEEETIAEEFGEDYNPNDYVIVFKTELSLQNAVKIEKNFEWEEYMEIIQADDDYRLAIPSLCQMGFDGWETTGSLGQNIYDDIAVFDLSKIRILEAKIKKSGDSSFSDYFPIEMVFDWWESKIKTSFYSSKWYKVAQNYWEDEEDESMGYRSIGHGYGMFSRGNPNDVVWFYDNSRLVKRERGEQTEMGGFTHHQMFGWDASYYWRGRYDVDKNLISVLPGDGQEGDYIPNILLRELKRNFPGAKIRCFECEV